MFFLLSTIYTVASITTIEAYNRSNNKLITPSSRNHVTIVQKGPVHAEPLRCRGKKYMQADTRLTLFLES